MIVCSILYSQDGKCVIFADQQTELVSLISGEERNLKFVEHQLCINKLNISHENLTFQARYYLLTACDVPATLLAAWHSLVSTPRNRPAVDMNVSILQTRKLRLRVQGYSV